jgi:hypothetical protein
MSAAAPARVVVVRTPAAARSRRAWRALAVNAAALLSIPIALHALAPEQRPIAAPMLVLAAIALGFISILWTSEGEMPLFESGTLLVLSTTMYGVLALLGFLMMHGAWAENIDFRLTYYPFVPAELGHVGWHYVVYLAAFAVTYLLVRRRASAKGAGLDTPRAKEISAIVIIFLALSLFRLVLKLLYGFQADLSYTELDQASAAAARMPFVVRQFSHHIVSALLIAQQGLLIILLTRWKRPIYRVVLAGWLAFEVLGAAARLGSRTEAVLLLLSAGLIYHRVVKPLSLAKFVTGGVLLVSGFTLVGEMRNFAGAPPGEPHASSLVVVNEFQVLFTNAYDIEKRRESHTIEAPWQIYAADLYMSIPSQLLPFEKLEPSTWYSAAIGVPPGLMFGVLAQAALGLGRVELVLRGIALGLFFGLMHRWYVRRAGRFWPTLFYLFLGVWTYYSFRATSFWFMTFILYQFLPVLAATKVIQLAMDRAMRRGDA